MTRVCLRSLQQCFSELWKRADLDNSPPKANRGCARISDTLVGYRSLFKRFGDFDCDGNVNILGSSSKDYHLARYAQLMDRPLSQAAGHYLSRWWLGTDKGAFEVTSSEETGTAGKTAFVTATTTVIKIY